MFAAAVLVVLAASRTRPMPTWTRLLQALGTVSYAAYLWNYIVILWLNGGSTADLPPAVAVSAILLTLLTVNALNFIDGLDGLAAGVSAIAALALFAYSYNLGLVGYDAGASVRTHHDPTTGRTWTVIANTSEGAWPISRVLSAG